MAVPQFTGSVSVPALGQFSSATSVPATFASAIESGPNPYGLVSIGDINASRSSLGGLLMLGGTTERGVLDFGITTAHTLTIQGIGGSATSNVIAQGTVQAAANGGPVSYVAPGYTSTGAAIASTFHIVQDTITANSSTTTVALIGAARFTTGGSYAVYIYDRSGLAVVAPTAQTLNSFTFTSTNTHIYTYMAIGT